MSESKLIGVDIRSILNENSESDIQKLLQIEYEKALKAFKDEEIEIEDDVVSKSHLIVRIFEFIPSKSLTLKRALGESTVKVVSNFGSTKGELIDSKIAKTQKHYPIVKILKKCKDGDPNIEVGSLYTVPSQDILGEIWNPDFLHNMNSFAKSSGTAKPSMVHVPEDMPQKLDTIKIKWGDYKYIDPRNVNQKYDDLYIIPDVKIKTKINL